MSSSFEIPEVDHFTAGTVGPPGQRVFYLQARYDGRVFTLRLEKTQVAALCRYFDEMLADLPPVEPSAADMDLLEPVVPEWVVGSLGVTYDEDDDRVVIVAEELVEEGGEPAEARLRATRAQVAAFTERGTELVRGGPSPVPTLRRPPRSRRTRVRPAERPSRLGPLSLQTLLTDGEIEVRGRLPWSSNGTFLVDVRLEDETSLAVYKPLQGERPLWDYPRGLYRREVATYLVSEWLGWGLVPETVERDQAPLGPGSLQRFVDADFEHHYFTLLERAEHIDSLRAVCAFDLLVNNGDRKGGHCLVDKGGRIWAIDHGLCLHVEPKLRTVMWDFEGQPIPPGRIEDVARVAAATDPPAGLAALLSEEELDALRARAERLLRRPVFPSVRSASVPVAPHLTVAELVGRGDLDELLRRVDDLCDARDWEAVLDLRNRCRAAFERGRQLWPVASHAEYRLALQAPGRLAAAVIEPGTGHFALGPLSEVVVSTHEWAELAPHLLPTPLAGIVAQERVVRGEDLTGDSRVDTTVTELPLRPAAWEPSYPLATYKPYAAEFDHPPDTDAWEPISTAPPGAAVIEDREVTDAFVALAHAWTSQSNGHVSVVAVEGTAADAVNAIKGARTAPITTADALAVMAWTAASGGAHGRRRGMAQGRFAAWWALAAVADALDDWPDLEGTIDDVRWYRWERDEPGTGWSLRLAAEHPGDGRAWAVEATDRK